MSKKRGIRIVIVVEDSMLDQFCRAALLELGFHKREIRVEMAPRGKGSGKQWVNDRYAIEVQVIRQKSDQQLAVLVGSDVDELTYAVRMKQLEDSLRSCRVSPREIGERVACWLPKWSIETWLLFYAGNGVKEDTQYKHNVVRPDFKSLAAAFVAEFRRSKKGAAQATLPALTAAHRETARIKA